MAGNVRWITADEVADNYEPIGGGGGVIEVATATANQTDILAFSTTKFEIVPAQGENTVIIPISCMAILHLIDIGGGVITPYTGITDASWVLVIGSGNSYASALAKVEGALASDNITNGLMQL